MHSPGNLAKGDECLKQFARQCNKGIPRRVGNTQNIGDKRVFGWITQNEGVGQGGEIENGDDDQETEG
mgnify:CR=1 FL=1